MHAFRAFTNSNSHGANSVVRRMNRESVLRAENSSSYRVCAGVALPVVSGDCKLLASCFAASRRGPGKRPQ